MEFQEYLQIAVLGYIMLIAIMVVLPVGRILQRVGFSPLFALVLFIPVVNLIFLYSVAFMKWPKHPDL